ncbi:hypothetical protein ACHAXR_005779, partial [Thalassiosira sp. AJA248-18]
SKKQKRLEENDVGSQKQLLLPSASGSNSTAQIGHSGSNLSGLSPHRQDKYNDDQSITKISQRTIIIIIQSIPTVDPDYNHVKSGNESLSEAGGTIGSQNQLSLSNFSNAASAFGSMAPSAFGASSITGDSIERRLYNDYNYGNQPSSFYNTTQSPQKQQEELLEIYAPAGKLGLVIDTPSSESTPIVHAIKDTCPIRNEIYVEDKLIAVDDVDVRDMSAEEVSKLISKKSGQGKRKLTIIRTARGRDGMY